MTPHEIRLSMQDPHTAYTRAKALQTLKYAFLALLLLVGILFIAHGDYQALQANLIN